MTTLRRLRIGAAFLALVSVLFSQLAISAYACAGPPGAERGTGPAAMKAVAISSMPDMPGCDESAPRVERTALCHAHCLQGDQSLDKSGASLQGAAAAIGYPALARFEPALPDVASSHARDPVLERPTGPPLAVRHCRFHI